MAIAIDVSSCSKRLVAALKCLAPKLKGLNELKQKKMIRKKLFWVLPSAADRVFRLQRRKYELKAQAKTEPGSPLKYQDKPRNPYHRPFESPYAMKKEKETHMKVYFGLSVVKSKAKIKGVKQKLWRLQKNKKGSKIFV